MYRLIFGLILLGCLAKSASAQRPDSISLDLSVGPSTGSSSKSDYFQRGTAAAEFTLAIGPTHSSGRIFALTVGGNASYQSAEVCAIDEAHPGQCRDFFPSTVHIGLLGGFHFGRTRAALRAMGGPVAFSGGGVSGAGLQAQIDGTAGLEHVALLAALRGQVLRRGTGETLYIRSLGIGLRLQ